jgi:phenylpyruvate tautomerase PptA (4-oxalocrotonate tautomerase family)
MPILDVQIALRPGEDLPPNLASAIANAAARVFGAPPGNTWVLVKALPASAYAEDSSPPGEGIFPVFASVLKARLGPIEKLKEEAMRLSKAIAIASQRPQENIHILYEPEALGRISFGGQLVME